MSNPVVVAAVPSLVSVLQAVQAFVSNLGLDPVQVPARFPGALAILLGSVELQLPVLASAEFGALQADANARIAGWVKSLQALAAPAA